VASFHLARSTPNARDCASRPVGSACLPNVTQRKWSAGAAETIATLKRHGKAVYVITGACYRLLPNSPCRWAYSEQVYAVKVYLTARVFTRVLTRAPTVSKQWQGGDLPEACHGMETSP
jgi:hypothetical protein